MVSADSKFVEAVSAERPLPGRGKFGSGRRVLSHLTRRVTDVLCYPPLGLWKYDSRLGIATRPSPLRIHHQKAVSEIPVPESGQSPLSPTDPHRPVPFLETGQSAKSRFCELECSEAAIGDFTLSATTSRSRCRPNSSRRTPLGVRFPASNLILTSTELGQQLAYTVAAAQPFKGPLHPETCPLAYASKSAIAVTRGRPPVRSSDC